jgi:hypothetical protein
MESAGWGFEMGSFQRVTGEFSAFLSMVCGEEAGRKAVAGAGGGRVGWMVMGMIRDRIRNRAGMRKKWAGWRDTSGVEAGEVAGAGGRVGMCGLPGGRWVWLSMPARLAAGKTSIVRG